MVVWLVVAGNSCTTSIEHCRTHILWDSCCSTFSSFYFHNITSTKTNSGSLHQISGLELSECDEERFEDTIAVIRSLNSRKDRQLNGLWKNNKKTNNSLPNATLKSKDWATQTVTCIMYSFYFIQIIWTTIRYCFAHQSFNQAFRIGKCPRNSPFLNNNCFKEWRDTRTFSNLKSTHCTLSILSIINLVTKVCA
jgi:hypothetical protein